MVPNLILDNQTNPGPPTQGLIRRSIQKTPESNDFFLKWFFKHWITELKKHKPSSQFATYTTELLQRAGSYILRQGEN